VADAAPAGWLPQESAELLRSLGALAAERHQGAWLVGGPVRDLVLGMGTVDLDVVVEGDGLAFARRAAERLGAGVQEYPKFHTATLTLPDLTRVDIATARLETYPRAAALPDVVPAPIGDDLRRRDFTVNAMAMAITPADFGAILDPYGGAADLAAQRLAILHPKSFLDDPTRILRMARFAARFGFTPDAGTAARLAEALGSRIFDFLSGDRLREEIFHVLHEAEPAAAFGLLAAWGVLPVILPAARPDGAFATEVEQMKHLVAVVEKGGAWDPAVACLLLLVRHAGADEVAEAARRLNLSPPARAALGRAPTLEATARRVEAAARTSALRTIAAGVPLEALLAILVVMNGEKARERWLNFLRTGRGAHPELTGDDLLAMGFAAGPGLKRILDALLDAKLDGEAQSRKAEEAYVREHFSPPHGEALS